MSQAALCCIRILRHLPEHVEDFMERIMDVLKDRHHGVLVAGVQLITAVVESDPKVRGVDAWHRLCLEKQGFEMREKGLSFSENTFYMQTQRKQYRLLKMTTRALR